MSSTRWDATRMHLANDDNLWELYHENSKTSRYSAFPSNEYVYGHMVRLIESLVYEGYPAVALPDTRAPMQLSLAEAILTRVTARRMVPAPISLAQLATLLHYAYGVTRDNAGTVFPRPFRVIPSGGGLYPLEIYFHTAFVPELEAGLYHYNPAENNVRLLRPGDESRRIAEALVFPHMATDSALLIFITALFERSTFKYGERGYRFILLEAGHLAQNVNLVANGLGLGCNNIGGYYDRQIDDFLGLDGVGHSTVYMIGVGQDAGRADDSPIIG